MFLFDAEFNGFILVLDKGSVVQKGKHADLMIEEGGIYKRIYEIQTQIEVELEKEISAP